MLVRLLSSTTVLSVAILCLSQVVSAAPVTTNITKSARIRDNGRTVTEINPGAAFVGDAGNDADNRHLMYFDLSSLAGQTVVGNGTLSIQLNLTEGTTDASDFFDLYVINDSNVGWITSTDPTWNELSDSGSTLWKDSVGTGLPFGSGNPAAPGSGDGGLGAPGDGYGDFQSALNQAIYVNGEILTWDISAGELQNMIDGTNAGFLLRKRDESTFGRLRLNGATAQLTLNTVVPEPASFAIWSLICLGLAGFGYYRRSPKG
jgi:hypothetical protein